MNGKLIKNLSFIIVIAYFFLPLNSAIAQQNDYLFYDQENTHVNLLSDSAAVILILKNNKNCLKCFAVLSEELSKRKSKAFKLYSLSHLDSSVFARKIERKKITQLMPKVEASYFDYTNENESFGYSENINPLSIFYNFKVDVTPAVVIWVNDEIKYYSYSELFGEERINYKALDEISHVIK